MLYRHLLLAAAAVGTATGYAPAGAWHRPRLASSRRPAPLRSTAAAVAAPSTPARRQVALGASPSGISEAVFAADERPVILFDGVCNLCNEGVNFILDHDAASSFRFAALQSEVGAALLTRCGRKSDDISTIVLVTKDAFFDRSSAIVRIGAKLDGPLPALSLGAKLVPRPLRNVAYGVVSRTRYALFGEVLECRLGDERFDRDFVSDEAMLAAAESAVTSVFLASGRFQSRPASALAASEEGGMAEVECDVVIIGGGPAGMTCALYTSRADHKTVVVDKNPAVGALAVTSHIANYPGVESTISGAALLDKMRDQAVEYGTEYHRAQVFLVDVVGEWKYVYTPAATFKARTMVLATGAMGRPPGFKGEAEFLGNGVSYCATCDGAFYRDSEVAVVGTSAEAIEEAEFLTKFAKTVHWITTAEVKADDVHAQDLLAHPSVKQWKQTRFLSVDGDASGVTGCTVQPKGDEAPTQLPVEGVFIYAFGSKPITDFLEQKVEFKSDGGVKVNDEMATNVDGVYAIGDIRNTPFKQVVVAAADGCVAAMDIDRFLKGRKKVRVDWVHE